MYGAILGDIIGSPYEFDRGKKSKEFPLFSEESQFTDDTVMTLAIAQVFHDAQPVKTFRQLREENVQWIRNRLVRVMQQFGGHYPLLFN